MKSRRILFLAINARYTHSNPSMLYLRKNIDDLDFDYSILEFSIAEKESKILDKIKVFNPGVLAISVYIWNTLKVKSLLKMIKMELADTIIVLGGPEVSFNSSEWIDANKEIDYIITGAGERGFRELALSDFSSGSRIIKRSNLHFSQIKFPYTGDDMKRLSGRYIYYESSRGCPFRCTYCLSSESGGTVEFRSIDQVNEELDFFSVYDPPLIKFLDRTFNINKKHYMPVWDYILKKFSGGNTRFHFEIYPDLLDQSDLDFLSYIPRGLFQFEIGIQSTRPETLNEIKRTGSWIKAEANIKTLLSYGNIHLHTDLIAGLPFEGYRDFTDSFNRVYSLGTEHFQAGFLKILPGTEMRRRINDYGIKFSFFPPYEIIENKWIESNELVKLKHIGELVDLIYNTGRFAETEKFMVSLYGSAFNFYERAADFFHRESRASHRHWEYLAGIFFMMIKRDFPDKILLVTDYLRWDWCSSMKAHHYPEVLKSELTFIAKRKGFRFFTEISANRSISYQGVTFSAAVLRRSIFFSPETLFFQENMMKDKMALFLPDRSIIFFNPD